MSSLALLMQNYSDSEDGSSDGENDKRRKSKRQKRRENEDVMQSDEENLREIELSDDIEQSNKIISQSSDNEENLTKLPADETSIITGSREIAPSLEQMELEKQLDEKLNTERPTIDYNQDYLEDDFYTLSKNEKDDEMNAYDNSDSSIINEDTNENNESDTSIQNDKCDQVEKLNCGQYSPKSFHRLLVGIDEQNIQIPDAPTNQCNEKLTEEVVRLHNKMKQGIDMTKLIKGRKSFRNPSIYEKLISYCNIDEFGTNLPSEIFDPDLFREKEPNDHDTSN